MSSSLGEFAAVFVFRSKAGFLSSPEKRADELRDWLENQGIVTPIVLVAASFGGFMALHFADRFPGRMAGLVLVDCSHPEQSAMALAAIADSPALPAVEKFRDYLRGFGPAWETSCREVARLPALGNLPLIVLAAGRPDMPEEMSAEARAKLTSGWLELQRRHAARSTVGELRVIENCGHNLVQHASQEIVRAIADLRQVVQTL
ncbi:alpha/beta fold hydrolase [Oleiharenicola lentus]|uniref:alpha/beta fold hydrolase n=1 Tax=Oleiharenicola lentus TaxID=2508720 RepID=UPI003F674054